MAALPAAQPQEAEGQDAALEEGVGLVFDESWQLASLSDPSRERYVIRDAAWQANVQALNKVYIDGVPELQKSYVAAQKLRADYDVICTSVLAYLDALHAVFNKDPGVTIESLTAALTQERQTPSLLAGPLADNMAVLKATQSKFDRPAGASGT